MQNSVSKNQVGPKRSFSLFNTKAGAVDLTFLILVLLLLTIGLVMLFSASYAFAFYNQGNSYAFISKQLFFCNHWWNFNDDYIYRRL